MHPEMPTCPDCGVLVGEPHEGNCDIARCPACGGQRLFDDCPEEDLAGLPEIPWTGLWPGVAECREFGWYAVLTSRGWQSRPAGTPGAIEDLNRLAVEARWDRKLQRFVRPDRAS